MIELLDRMAEIMADEGDLTEVVPSRGLYVAHNAPPVHFRGFGCPQPDSPELPSRTFAKAVGERFGPRAGRSQDWSVPDAWCWRRCVIVSSSSWPMASSTTR